MSTPVEHAGFIAYLIRAWVLWSHRVLYVHWKIHLNMCFSKMLHTFLKYFNYFMLHNLWLCLNLPKLLFRCLTWNFIITLRVYGLLFRVRQKLVYVLVFMWLFGHQLHFSGFLVSCKSCIFRCINCIILSIISWKIRWGYNIDLIMCRNDISIININNTRDLTRYQLVL